MTIKTYSDAEEYLIRHGIWEPHDSLSDEENHLILREYIKTFDFEGHRESQEIEHQMNLMKERYQ